MKTTILYQSLLSVAILLGVNTMVSAQSNQMAPVQDIAEEEVFKKVERMPQFPGGDNALQTFLAKNLRYPAGSRDNGITGAVAVSFIVRKDGKIENVKIIRGVATDLDEEAVRVVKLMPNWLPGEMDGKPVAVLYNLPVKFSSKP